MRGGATSDHWLLSCTPSTFPEGSPLEGGGGERHPIGKGSERESSWPLLSLSPPPALNQEGVPKFTAPFFIVGGMRGTSSLS